MASLNDEHPAAGRPGLWDGAGRSVSHAARKVLSQPLLVVLRCIFLMVAAGIGVRMVKSGALPDNPTWLPWIVFSSLMLLSLGVIVGDALFPRKNLGAISAVYFGLIVGLFLSYILHLALEPVLPESGQLKAWTNLVIGLVLCYTCISLIVQTKDDFRFIIPYVEFSKDVKGLKPIVLDTSVVIDGRIADVLETGVIDSQVMMPRFVIAELQGIADSSDKLRRGRGRRGLDILNRLRSNPNVDLKIHEAELPEYLNQPVDMKLVLLAKHLEGKVVTNDYNLNKIARLHGVGVVNLNDLANSLKPVCLPGENLQVRIVKQGEEAGQGVGYLQDGTMVVVEGGREHVNSEVRIAVTSVLQTSAGRMIFGRYDAPAART